MRGGVAAARPMAVTVGVGAQVHHGQFQLLRLVLVVVGFVVVGADVGGVAGASDVFTFGQFGPDKGFGGAQRVQRTGRSSVVSAGFGFHDGDALDE